MAWPDYICEGERVLTTTTSRQKTTLPDRKTVPNQTGGCTQEEQSTRAAWAHPVWLKYCIASRGLSILVAQQSPKPLPPHHVTCWATHCPLPRDELVVETLMIAFVMIMGQVLLDRIRQGAFP